jgi:hypothetical protein
MEISQNQVPLQVLDVEQRLVQIKGALGVIPWTEKIKLIQEYHYLRIAQRVKEMKTWAIKDTAEELNIGYGTCAEAMRLCEALKERPELADGSKDMALDWMRKKG